MEKQKPEYRNPNKNLKTKVFFLAIFAIAKKQVSNLFLHKSFFVFFSIFILCSIFYVPSSLAAPQISLTAIINEKGTTKPLSGEYSIRFAIYTQDRTDNNSSDSTGKIWEETQTAKITNGLLRISLGTNTNLPTNFDSLKNQYFLGI